MQHVARVDGAVGVYAERLAAGPAVALHREVHAYGRIHRGKGLAVVKRQQRAAQHAQLVRAGQQASQHLVVRLAGKQAEVQRRTQIARQLHVQGQIVHVLRMYRGNDVRRDARTLHHAHGFHQLVEALLASDVRRRGSRAAVERHRHAIDVRRQPLQRFLGHARAVRQHGDRRDAAGALRVLHDVGKILA